MLEKLAKVGAWAEEFTLKFWLFLAGVLFVVLSVITFAWHERGIGEQKCQARVDAAAAETEAKVKLETLALAPYLDKYNALDQSLKLNAPPTQTDFTCAAGAPDVVRRANAR